MLINDTLVCNNTHDGLCIVPFAIYVTPDGQVQIIVYDL
jgi:hypothetical protein